MYDFANSAFATTIITVVYSVYLVGRVVPAEGARLLGLKLDGATIWAIAYATSLAISAAMAPIIGAVCDYSASKKKFLVFFWLVGCLSTMALYFVVPGDWILGSVLFIVANICFESSVSLNSAFLPELAPADQLDRISSIGWGIGYIGGGTCLFLNLLMIGESPKDSGIRAALASVGVWWFVFGLITMLFVRERAIARPLAGAKSIWTVGFSKVVQTIRGMKRFRTLARLTISVLVFSAGVNTVLAMSGPFAQEELNFSQPEIIKCFLMIQGVGAVGAGLAAFFSGRVPTKTTLLVMLCVWLAAIAWAYFMQRKLEFWMLGVVIGLVMGGTQALSRGLQAQLTPPSATGEFFGFYGVTGKLAAAGANYIFAAANAITGDIRAGIASIMLLFIAGLWLLYPVDVSRGRREAEDEEQRLQAAP